MAVVASAVSASMPRACASFFASSAFKRCWQRAHWGATYPRLLEVKNFFVHHGVGSERWSADGFTRLV